MRYLLKSFFRYIGSEEGEVVNIHTGNKLKGPVYTLTNNRGVRMKIRMDEIPNLLLKEEKYIDALEIARSDLSTADKIRRLSPILSRQEIAALLNTSKIYIYDVLTFRAKKTKL